MATTIITKYGSGAPTASDVVRGELAVDTENGRLYTEDSGGSVVEIGLNPSGNVDVTGTVTADGLTVDGDSTFDFTTGTGKLSIRGVSGTYAVNYHAGENGLGYHLFSTRTSLADVDRLLINNNGDISFYEDTGTTAKLFWDASAESLGIGTSSPETLLMVEQAGTYTGVHNTAGLKVRNAAATTGVNNPYGAISLSKGTGSAGIAAIGDSASDADVVGLGFFVHGSTTGTDAATRAMTIDSSGNVGIGTTSPDNKFHVVSGAAGEVAQFTGAVEARGLSIRSETNTDASAHVVFNSQSGGSKGMFTFETDGTERMRIDSSGNVGIGTDSPTGQGAYSRVLHVHGSSTGSHIKLTDSGTGSTAGDGTDILQYGSDFYLINRENGTMRFHANSGTEAMRIDSSGNLLVNQTGTGDYTTTAGSSFRANGFSTHTRDGGETLLLNRLTSDGDIAVFRKDNSTVGSIGTVVAGAADQLYINSDDVGLRFRGSDDSIVPCTSAGAFRDGFIDLGKDTGRFKDLYLSGTANAGGLTVSNSSLQVKLEETDGTYNPRLVTYFDASGTHLQHTYSSVANSLIFENGGAEGSGTEAMRIDSSGNLLVGTTSSTSDEGGIVARPDSDVSNIYIGHATGTSGGNPYIRFRYGSGNIGSITQSGTTAVLYNTSSDQRLKENIVDAPSASDDIDAIQVRSFDWKADGSHQKYGMIAQELQTVAPDAVSVPEDPEEMMGVDFSKLVPMMLKEIQQLRARVAQLEGV